MSRSCLDEQLSDTNNITFVILYLSKQLRKLSSTLIVPFTYIKFRPCFNISLFVCFDISQVKLSFIENYDDEI